MIKNSYKKYKKATKIKDVRIEGKKYQKMQLINNSKNNNSKGSNTILDKKFNSYSKTLSTIICFLLININS